MRTIIHGLDSRTNSIGWTLFSQEDDCEPAGIIDIGCGKLTKSIEEKKSSPKNMHPRQALLASRVIKWSARRKRRMQNYLIQLTVTAIVGAAAMAQAGIMGSAHDFTLVNWSNNEPCLPCHTPHLNPGTEEAGLAWNHAVKSQTFIMYSNPATIDGVIDSAPTGVTKLCLSCHDGVTALDSFVRVTGDTKIASTASVGINLSDDHPVGIVYGTDPYLVSSSTLPLYDNKVECPTCHDVHNNSGNPYLLRIVNTKSALCLACHKK